MCMRGSIVKRGKTYSVVVDVGKKSDGSRDWKWFGGHKTRKAVEKFLAVMTGMRLGEILALRWSDIDFERKTATINGTQKWIEGKPFIKGPKTQKSRRMIALSPETISALRRHKSQQAEDRLLWGADYRDHDFIVARPDGWFMHPKTFQDAWYRARNRSELPKMRFHDLRHLHASLLLQQGVHPKIVSERLGHSTIGITMDIYSHVAPGLQAQVANEFDTLLFGKTTKAH